MRRRGFTLVELIVVMVVIGILAAIAIPRITQSAQRSGPTATREDLKQLQTQIEMYCIEHANVYPASVGDGTSPAHTEAAFLSQMTMYSDANGRVSISSGGGFRFGPYLRTGVPALKIGPKTGAAGVKVVTGTTALAYDAAGAFGWLYNDTRGQIVPNAPGLADSAKTFEVGADQIVSETSP